MATLLDLNADILNRFSQLLLSFLKSEESLHARSFDSLAFFLNNKGNQFDIEIVRGFFTYFYNNRKSHNVKVLESIINSFSDNTLDITAVEINDIIIQTTERCDKCNKVHSSELLITVFKKVSLSNQEIISKRIADKLKTKFDFNLFYLATLDDVIDFDRTELMRLINGFDVKKQNHTFRSVFGGYDDFSNHYIDELLNLCFKFEIDTITPEFDKFRMVSLYYCWLTDMEGFDYSNFDPEWILHHQTLYYFITMSKSQSLITALKKFLSINRHSGIERVFIKISQYL
jgi:hypothetical protein